MPLQFESVYKGSLQQTRVLTPRPPRVILSGAIAQRLRSRNPRRKRRRAIAARSDLRGAPCSHKSCINVTKIAFQHLIRQPTAATFPLRGRWIALARRMRCLALFTSTSLRRASHRCSFNPVGATCGRPLIESAPFEGGRSQIAPTKSWDFR